MNSFQIFEEENEQVRERLELCRERIAQIPEENSVKEPYRDYFVKMARWLELIYRTQDAVLKGEYRALPLKEKEGWNQKLYEDIFPENYETSYANPDYCVKCFGRQCGKPLTVLTAELRGLISSAFEGRFLQVVIVSELFIEIYNYFEEFNEYTHKDAKRAIYYYAYDYAEELQEYRTRELLDPTLTFAPELILESDLTNHEYLYEFGCYISENEKKLAEYFAGMTEDEVQAMADTWVDGYIRGFEVMGADLSKKSIVNIRYCLGFERMVRAAVRRLEAIGKRVTLYRLGDNLLTRRGGRRIGYYGTSPNPQYDYDHRNDDALIYDKALKERRVTAYRLAYDKYKIEAAHYAGPMVLETFGDRSQAPANKAAALKPDKRQIRLKNEYQSEVMQIGESYIPSEETSFTIIAYPIPAIGEEFEAIFTASREVNNLDNAAYKRIQQTIIDVLDQGVCCTIKGTNGNETDLTVMLHELVNPENETNFENCTADVNIPVGEVFTSPKLAGTNGLLHVSRVSLNGFPYENLRVRFENGMTAECSCSNFEKEEDNKSFVYENLLHSHDSLALGEFAIGTNTTAYVMGRNYGITELLPILIAEKTGPHFAIGDTCYSHSEDHKVYNPDGKEIIARENEVSALRNTEPEKAYFNCHTDITIPYHEIGEIAVRRKDGSRIAIIRNGRFVLPGTEELNLAFETMH
ncbi:MAG: aminopeptidase [Lachnospiraceae bacterium]|nr:aminopeptidase [Lachnospiraceae bacterium]